MNNKLISIIVGGSIAIILIAGVLIPVVNDAQSNAGERTSYTNEGFGSIKYDTDNKDVTVALSGATLTINGGVVNLEPTTYYIMSDAAFLMTIADQQFIGWFGNDTIAFVTSADLAFSNGHVTGTATTNAGNISIDAEYSTLFYASADGEYTTVQGNSPHYVSSIKDVAYCYYYDTGANDTGISFINGVLTAGAYEAATSYTLAKVEGTTDIYSLTDLTFIIGTETTSPWMMLIKSDISGHLENTTYNSLFAIIPIVAIIMVIVGIAGYIRLRTE